MTYDQILIGLGIVFLVGLVADEISRRWPVPRVTFMVAAGVLLGPELLGWLPLNGHDVYEFVSRIALTMVGFLVGGEITRQVIVFSGFRLIIYSLVISLITAAVVFGGLWLAGVPITIAVLLAGISTSTDPAATLDVVEETQSHGTLAKGLKVIVALDDIWGLLIFSISLTVADALMSGQFTLNVLTHASMDIGGAVFVGIAVGIPMAFLTGRLRAGEPTVAEALGMVFLCAGIAMWLDVSYLLASMVLGAWVVNFAKHHHRPFSSVAGLEWPFLILFFVLSGASLNLAVLADLGLIGAAYILLRIVGRFVGGLPGRYWLTGARSGGLTGLALLPQAGVALGMALVAGDHYPEIRDTLITVVIAATVVFELVGPLVSRYLLSRETNTQVP